MLLLELEELDLLLLLDDDDEELLRRTPPLCRPSLLDWNSCVVLVINFRLGGAGTSLFTIAFFGFAAGTFLFTMASWSSGDTASMGALLLLLLRT